MTCSPRDVVDHRASWLETDTPFQRFRVVALIVAVVILGGCSAAASSAPAPSAVPSSSAIEGTVSSATVPTSAPRSISPASAPPPSGPTVTPRPACPNPEGQACLGLLKAGTYQTLYFEPSISYTVPDGWQNFEDETGNFLLVAPGFDLAGVNAGGSDFIGVYSGVRAENRKCATDAEAVSDQPGVDSTVTALAKEFASRPGLVTTKPAKASVGGLNGVVMDIHLDPHWTGTCFYAPTEGAPIVQLLGGTGTSSLDHPLVKDLYMRLYLLEYKGGALGIEVDDFAKGAHLDTYSAIIDQFNFRS